MNEHSPDIIEQAFLYASILPLSPCTEDIEFDTSLQATEQNLPNYSNVNLDFVLPHFDLTTQPFDFVNLTKSYDIGNLGEDIADIEKNAFENKADSDVNQLQPTSGTAQVHSDSCSGMQNDVQDIDTIDYTCLQQQNDCSVDAPSSTETNVGFKKKRRRKREKNPDPPPEPILPPCSICEEKSSGYHYGANTCEACKGFFGRTLKKKEIRYKCKCKPDERVAWKRGPFKNGCPACRYKRCLDVGMSKQAIKIGRYTLVHKTKNIKKVKSIEAVESSMRSLTHSLPGTNPSAAGTVDIVAPAEHSSEISNEAMLSLNDTHQTGKRPSLSLMDTSIPALKRKSEFYEKSSVSLCMSCITLKEIKSVVKTLTDAHTILDFNEVPMEIIKKRQKDYSEKYRLKMEQFGSMPTLSNEEYQEFFKVTGMDLDGRLEQIHAAFKFFEEHFRTVIGFAKAIPGFKTLPLDDQANLVKVSRVESTMIRVYKYLIRNVDMESRVFSTPWGTHLHLDEIQKWLPSDILMERRKFGKQLLELNLTAQEESVIRAIIIVSSDRCPLEQLHKVDAIQEKLITCLQYLLSIRQGGAGTLLYRIFSLLTNLRELTDKELDLSKRFFVDWPMLTVNNYQLLKEFVS